MSAERLAFATGGALVLASVVLAVLTVRLFVASDIRGVRDDLSGKARQRGMDLATRAAVRAGGKPVTAPGRDVAWDGGEPAGSGGRDGAREREEQATLVDCGADTLGEPPFVLVRREVAINSSKIVPIGEE